jgi:hypothetical protein
MADSPMEKQLAGFSRWKQRQRKILDQLEPWLQQQNLYSSEIHHAIGRARAALRDDNVTVAITGEFSRGKTELINALFFSNLGFRLLPTDAGRTTMCPTEILQDPTQEPCLRLLPIETRGHDISLFHLRRKPELWTTIPLQLDDPEILEEMEKLNRRYLEELVSQPDYEEGLRAFMEKRPPRWGRKDRGGTE